MAEPPKSLFKSHSIERVHQAWKETRKVSSSATECEGEDPDMKSRVALMGDCGLGALSQKREVPLCTQRLKSSFSADCQVSAPWRQRVAKPFFSFHSCFLPFHFPAKALQFPVLLMMGFPVFSTVPASHPPPTYLLPSTLSKSFSCPAFGNLSTVHWFSIVVFHYLLPAYCISLCPTNVKDHSCLFFSFTSFTHNDTLWLSLHSGKLCDFIFDR